MAEDNIRMTNEQKKECKKSEYMHYECDCVCDKCKKSYNYVLGFDDGYNTGYHEGSTWDKE